MKTLPNSTQYRCFPSSSKPLLACEEDISKVKEERFNFGRGYTEFGTAGGGGSDDTVAYIGSGAKDEEEASLK